MKYSKLNTIVITLFLTLIFLVSCSEPSIQATVTPEPINELQEPIGDHLGTLNGKVLTSTDMSTGASSVHGVGVDLDNGESIDAYLAQGVIEVIMKGIRVRVTPINHDRYEWQVAEIIPGGVSTPDISATQEAHCKLVGFVLDLGTTDLGASIDDLHDLFIEESGCEFEFIIGSYDLIPLIFTAGDADFGIIHFTQYRTHRDSLGVTPLLLSTNTDLSAYYRGGYIASIDSTASSITEFEGKTFAYPVKYSSFGYYLPRLELELAGYDPNTFFSETLALGSTTEDIIASVMSGEADLGVVWAQENSDALEMAAVENIDVLDTIKFIDYTPWIPGSVFIVSDYLSEEHRAAIKDAFQQISLEDDGKEALLNVFSISGFVEIDDRFWNALDLLDQAEQIDIERGEWP